MALKEQLKSLARLHHLDGELGEISKRHEAITEQIAGIKEAVVALESDLQMQMDGVEDTVKLRRSQEAELKAHGDIISRAKGKMAGVKNAREYMAVEREVESARRASSSVEDQILQLIEAEETSKEALGSREAKLSELKGMAEAQSATAEAEAAQLGKRLEKVNAAREVILSEVRPQLLARYNRINSVHTGSACAPVVDGSCGACNMHLPAQLFNILIRAQTLETCPSCKRIIYWSELLADEAPVTADDDDAVPAEEPASEADEPKTETSPPA
jgi:predicted  nucleic acid-binding Zn-ribbon protein